MELSERLENLSPELYQTIYDFTFTPNSPTYHIDNTYTPPVQLHVDRASRLSFAKLFYGNGTFFTTDLEAAEWCQLWLASLPLAHKEMIKTLHFELAPYTFQLEWPGHVVFSPLDLMDDKRGIVELLDAHEIWESIYISVLCGPQKGKRWITSRDELVALGEEFPLGSESSEESSPVSSADDPYSSPSPSESEFPSENEDEDESDGFPRGRGPPDRVYRNEEGSNEQGMFAGSLREDSTFALIMLKHASRNQPRLHHAM